MSELTLGEQRQAVLLDGQPLEGVVNFKYLAWMFIASGQGTEEVKNSINLAHSVFSRLQSCLRSRREILCNKKAMVYEAVVPHAVCFRRGAEIAY